MDINFLDPHSALTESSILESETTLPSAPHSAGDPADGSADNFQPLDPRSIRVEQLVGLIIVAVIAFASLIGLVIAAIAGMGFSWLWLTIVGGAGLFYFILFLLAWRWPVLEHRHSRWRWDVAGLEIHRGVYWRHQITIPSSRIQHVDVSQGPLQRQFGLGKVTIHTAGTQNASIEQSGLAYETALWLREQMIAKQGLQDEV